MSHPSPAAPPGRWSDRLRALRDDDAGMSTAEYAIGTIAAAAFAAILYAVVTTYDCTLSAWRPEQLTPS